MSVVYLSFFCFKRKDKRVKLCGKPEMSSFFFLCPSNTDLAIVFLLTREIKLVILYCHDVNDDYDHLFTRCTRCPPACVCMKGAMTV